MLQMSVLFEAAVVVGLVFTRLVALFEVPAVPEAGPVAAEVVLEVAAAAPTSPPPPVTRVKTCRSLLTRSSEREDSNSWRHMLKHRPQQLGQSVCPKVPLSPPWTARSALLRDVLMPPLLAATNAFVMNAHEGLRRAAVLAPFAEET